MLAARPLFSLLRGGHEEVCVYGEVVVCRGDGGVYRSGEAGSRLVARSLLKPFQFIATGLASAARDLEPRHVAALGSISATPEQVEQLRAWYAAAGLGVATPELVVPGALPLCPASRVRELAAGKSPLHHPCFSKHMAILEACRARGWPAQGYASARHPFHGQLVALLDSMLGRAGSPLEFVEDGCALPTPVLDPLELARLYLELARAADPTPLGRVRRAMVNEPTWIGGPERVDTQLMERNPGLIAKEGADGMLALGIAPSAREPSGAGLLLKLASGYQPAWAELALRPFLDAWGLQPLDAPTPGQQVLWHVGPTRAPSRPLDISPLLSERIAVWPGDTPFRRTALSEPGAEPSEGGPGWQLLVSNIHTTLHVGAHADAPNHFQSSGVGIDRVPLEPYRGRCAVVQIALPPGATITPSQLGSKRPLAPRLLFKTGSFPNPERFDADFVAFSPELIAWLEESGVVLIGIDTPSVDPFSSKTLPSHHQTRAGAGLAILEGLDLSQVPAGEYELVALPLRIEGADASPVRATLWPLR
jgi:arylformamidase